MAFFIDKDGTIANTGSNRMVTVDDFWAACFEYGTNEGVMCRYNYCNDYDALHNYVQSIIKFYNEDLEADECAGTDLDAEVIKQTAPGKWISSGLRITIGPADNRSESFIAAMLKRNDDK